MKKLMEVYAVDNGLLFKKNESVYHLFGVSDNEAVESVKIADAVQAFEFLANFFVDKLKIKKTEMLHFDTFERDVQLSFEIRK